MTSVHPDTDDNHQAESGPDFLYLMSISLNRRTVLECLNIKRALAGGLD